MCLPNPCILPSNSRDVSENPPSIPRLVYFFLSWLTSGYEVRSPCHFHSSFDDLALVQHIIFFLLPSIAVTLSGFFCTLLFVAAFATCAVCPAHVVPLFPSFIKSLKIWHAQHSSTFKFYCVSCLIMLCQIPPTVLPSALQLRVSWHIFPLCFCRGNFAQSHFAILETRDCHVDRFSIFRCVGNANLRHQFPSLSFHRRPLPSQLTYEKKSSSDIHNLAEDEVVC